MFVENCGEKSCIEFEAEIHNFGTGACRWEGSMLKRI